MKPDITNLILYEDAHIIVCRKPAGTATQTSRVGTADLVSLLKNHLASKRTQTQAKKQNKTWDSTYLAVIHRLDQPVDGLLVFAKTPAAAKKLNRQLTGGKFGKYYLAVVSPVPAKETDILENYMIKDSRLNLSRICSAETPDARLARLHYRVLNSDKNRALLEIHLNTGRHHQIRVQMAHAGFPLEGDRKYGNKNSTEPLRLCAYKLEFIHPATKKPMQFKLDDPFADADLHIPSAF